MGARWGGAARDHTEVARCSQGSPVHRGNGAVRFGARVGVAGAATYEGRRLGAVGAGLGAFDRDALGATGVVRRQYQRVTIATTMPKMAHASATSHSFVIGEIPSPGAVASTGPSTSSAGGPGVVVGTAASVARALSLVPTFAAVEGLTAAVVGVAVVDFGRAAAVVGAAALVDGGAFALDVVAVGLSAATGFVVGVVGAVVAVLAGAVDDGAAGFAVVGAAVVGVAIVAALAAVATPVMPHPEVSASASSAARPPNRRVGRLKMGTQAPGDEFRPLPTREGIGSPPPTRGCSRPPLAPPLASAGTCSRAEGGKRTSRATGSSALFGPRRPAVGFALVGLVTCQVDPLMNSASTVRHSQGRGRRLTGLCGEDENAASGVQGRRIRDMIGLAGH